MLRWNLLVCLLVIAVSAVAEVPTVHCPADPPVIRTMKLVERWRIDAEDEDAALIGVVSRVCSPEPGGDLYFLDRQLCQVLIYTADGEFLDTVGREGEGPGEFRRPYDFFLLEDGTLAIKDGWPSKLVYLAPDGLPAGGWSPSATLSLGRLCEVPGGWIANGQDQNEERSDPNRIYSDLFLARFDEDGEQIHDYLTGESVHAFQPQTHDERQPYFPHSRWDLTAAGQIVVCTDRDVYRLEFLDLDGAVLRVVERDFEPYRRTAEDKDEIRDGTRMYMNGVRQEIVFHLLDTEPVISGLVARPDGKIRVTTCYSTRDLPDGVVVRHDIHGADGTLLEEVRITGDCDLEFDALRLLPDGRAVVLRNYEAAMRAARSMVEEGDEAREDATFEVIVCELVEVS